MSSPPPLHPWIAERLHERRFRYGLERTRLSRGWPRHPWHLRGWL